MRRGYSREAYLQLIDDVRATIPEVAISSDFITGFCDETEEEHQDTLTLMEQVAYDQAYMFAYSMRGKTHAHRSMEDNIPEEVKQRRLQEIINVFRTKVQERNEATEVGRLRLVLLEGESKKSKEANPTWGGRTDQNKRIIFPKEHYWSSPFDGAVPVEVQKGDYAVVEVTEVRGHTLRGNLLWRSSIEEFSNVTLDDELRLKNQLTKPSLSDLTA